MTAQQAHTDGGPHVWELRETTAASMGLEFARGKLAPADVVVAHALPERVSVEVRTADGALVARGDDLRAQRSLPMARLVIRNGAVSREDVWPDETDLGRPVILPGGEVGLLRAWWNADDGSEWRWTVEFHNRR
ncbi:MAG: hypothetical protein JO198_12295 [Candidatus Dormibacteraeota bacterium]|nr:hypothetical protein [Candidatus Dormibacteraeota bacterium]